MFEYFGPNEVIELYKQGVFPMADGRDDPRIMLIDPEFRGIFDLDNFHIPKRLKREIRKTPFRISANKNFRAVIEACALTRETRQQTWINDKIIQLYDALNRIGKAHSIEVWHNDELVGGLYGVSIGSVFFGESMFSTMTNASKIALVHLAAALKFANYKLLDAQFHNDHLEQFGILEIPRIEFRKLLNSALLSECKFPEANFLAEENQGANLCSGPYCLALLNQ